MGNPRGESEDEKDRPQGEESSEEEEEEDEGEVAAAVLDRSKRATAGRRLTDLIGKAAEDDQAFWGHDTWAEDGSDNDSFRESDEDPEQRIDKFDSDFDDSENDNDDEEVADGEKEDAELQKQEKKNQRQRSNKYDVGKAARDLGRVGGAGGKGQHWSGPARILGDGDNAGIVLNLPQPKESGKLYEIPGVAVSPFVPTFYAPYAPPSTEPLPSIPSETPAPNEATAPELPLPTESKAPELPIPTESKAPELPVIAAPLAPPSAAHAAKPVSHSSHHHHLPSKVSKLSATASQRRPARRATEHSKYSSRFRVARNLPMGEHHNAAHGPGSMDTGSPNSDAVPSSTAGSAHGSAHHHTHKRKLTAAERAGEKPKRHRTDVTQDQLIMEAVHTTAPENHRWLLGRKRAADEMEYIDKLTALAARGGAGGGDKKLVQRYSSRRGTLNVVSFYEMDYVPTIFTNQQLQEKDRIKPSVCVVTGKPARYRDPKSWLPYHDKDAFVELRKRLEDGRLKPANKHAQDTKKKRPSAAAPSSRATAPKAAPSNNTNDAHEPETVVENANETTTDPTITTDDGADAKPIKAAPAKAKPKAKAAPKRATKKKTDTDTAAKPKAAPKSRSKKALTKDEVPGEGEPSAPVSTESSVGSEKAPVDTTQPDVAPLSSQPPVQTTVVGSIQSADPAAAGETLSSKSDPPATNGASTKTAPKSQAKKTPKRSPGKAGATGAISAQSIVAPGKAPGPTADVATVAHSSSQPFVATSTNGSGVASNSAPAQAVQGAVQPAPSQLTSAVTPTKVELPSSSPQTVPPQKELFRPSTPVTPTKESSSTNQSTTPLSSTSSSNKQQQLPDKAASSATPKRSTPNKNNSKNTPTTTQTPVQIISSSTIPANEVPSSGSAEKATQSKPQINQVPKVAHAKTPKTQVASGVPLTQTESEPPAASSNSSKG